MLSENEYSCASRRAVSIINTISHVLYMHDIKSLNWFSFDVETEFNFDKYKIPHIQHGC
jgi:hypothetical protein